MLSSSYRLKSSATEANVTRLYALKVYYAWFPSNIAKTMYRLIHW